jgi:hypothetical protein
MRCRCLLTGCPLLAFATTSAARVRIVLTASSSSDKGEKPAIFRSDLWGGWMGDKRNGWGGWDAHSPAYMISGSRRQIFPRSPSKPITSPTLSSHYKCTPRSPTGSVCPPSTPPNPSPLTPETSGLQGVLPGPRSLPRRQLAQVDRRMQRRQERAEHVLA